MGIRADEPARAPAAFTDSGPLCIRHRCLAADMIGRDAVGPRTVRLAYEARVTPPAGVERVELWLAVTARENQAVRELKLTGTVA